MHITHAHTCIQWMLLETVEIQTSSCGADSLDHVMLPCAALTFTVPNDGRFHLRAVMDDVWVM